MLLEQCQCKRADLLARVNTGDFGRSKARRRRPSTSSADVFAAASASTRRLVPQSNVQSTSLQRHGNRAVSTLMSRHCFDVK
jgi:hypothetical protein